MSKVSFTLHLKRFIDNLESIEISADDVYGLMNKLKAVYPELNNYVLDDHGSLRKDVNITIDGEQIQEPVYLTDSLNSESDVQILPVL